MGKYTLTKKDVAEEMINVSMATAKEKDLHYLYNGLSVLKEYSITPDCETVSFNEFECFMLFSLINLSDIDQVKKDSFLEILEKGK